MGAENTLTADQLRQQAITEIEAVKRERGDDWYSYFHYLQFLFPYSDPSGAGTYYLNHLFKGKEDRAHQEILEEIGDSRLQHCSNLYLSQTPRQFIEEVDRLIGHAGIPGDEIKRLQDLRRQNAYSFSSDATEEEMETTQIRAEAQREARSQLFELMIPLYVELRAAGYNVSDLG